ncbi:MAG: heparinase II/III family protein [Rhodobacteraceae bacterium]|nr:heparinase II/III family protein [Paracoccaceae bacterium]
MWARLAWLFHVGPRVFSFGSSTEDDRLLIAPQDLRTADGTNAADIYGGRFLFSGHLVETNGASPFEMEGMHKEWLRELHSFGWIRDLRAADSNISRQNARALVDDWLHLSRRRNRTGWETDVVNRRVMMWLAHSPFILADGDHAFYARFVKSLERQVRFLRRAASGSTNEVLRLQIALTLTAASVALSSERRTLKYSIRGLDQELQRQILTDGGHISRNPGAMIEILADLLPVRQALVSQGIELPASMMQSVDRMMPMMRFFRHSDGSYAQFNGMGQTPHDLVATILAYDDARGGAPDNVPHTGYQRLTGGGAVVIVDAGKAPTLDMSRDAHAGFLSFELSSGRHRLVVNCGVSARAGQQWRRVSRSTPAHSTVTIEDTNSARFLNAPALQGFLGTPIVSGPRNVEVSREDSADGQKVVASHDGYVEDFGLKHLRSLQLSPDGGLLSGVDVFTNEVPQKLGEYNFAVRFHIHPGVTIAHTGEGEQVQLVCRDGEVWEFDSPGADLAVEESVFLSDASGPRRAEQIVLYGNVAETPSIAWQFRKVSEATREYAPMPAVSQFDFDAFAEPVAEPEPTAPADFDDYGDDYLDDEYPDDAYEEDFDEGSDEVRGEAFDQSSVVGSNAYLEPEGDLVEEEELLVAPMKVPLAPSADRQSIETMTAAFLGEALANSDSADSEETAPYEDPTQR